MLHEGPVPPDGELARVRAQFLAATWADEGSAYRDLRATEDAVAGAEEVALWFEHDLFDQLLLLQALTVARGRALLVLSDTYLNEADLPALWRARTEATGEQRGLAAEAWEAFRSGDPRRLAALDASALPHLGPALRRLLQELPSTANGLGRTEQLIVDAVAGGAATFGELFARTQALDEPRFMGDAAFALQLGRVAPLVGAGEPYALTVLGERVRAGEADFVREAGIDRRLGGLHLHGTGPLWRWDGARPVHA